VFHRWQHLRSWSRRSLSETVTAHGLIVIRCFATDFARRPLRDPVHGAKRLVKRLIGRAVHDPHLVCVARLPA
jgi:hypothetical protein